MGIECFDETVNTITLAKELYDIGRYDIVEKNFYDVICYDTYYENIISMIESIFEIYYERYNEFTEEYCMIFIDRVISDYYCIAWEYGKKHKIPYDKNPYTTAAEKEVAKWLNFSYSLGWKLLGYTKSEAKAKKSRLIVYTCACEFCEHDHLAYGLLMIYKWFYDKCVEFRSKKEEIAA